MSRNHYAHPIDALRRFDPSLTVEGVKGGDLGAGGYEKLVARLSSTEDTFENKTGHSWRIKEVGASGTPETYEYYEASLNKFQGGIKIYLDHRHVMPPDPAEGDAIQVRTGIDNWRDITNRDGELWRLNPEKGTLQLTGSYRFAQSPYRRAVLDDNIRVRYRYGGLGGSRDRGGETRLSEALAVGDTAAPVDEASRLPRSGPLLLGGTEWVYAERDVQNGRVEIVTRGDDGTDEVEHAAGTKVNYCPQEIREAVAARVAAELANTDDHYDQLVESGENTSVDSKIERWEAEWESALQKWSGTVTL